MKIRIKNYFRKNIITTAISLISTLLIINVALIFHNKSTIIHNNEAKKEAEVIRFLAEQLVSYSLHNMDMGIRAYGLTKSKELLKPCSTAISKIEPAFNELEARLQKQSYDVSGLRALRK